MKHAKPTRGGSLAAVLALALTLTPAASQEAGDAADDWGDFATPEDAAGDTGGFDEWGASDDAGDTDDWGTSDWGSSDDWGDWGGTDDTGGWDDWGDFGGGDSGGSFGGFGSGDAELTFSGEAELQGRIYVDRPTWPEQADGDYESVGDFPVTADPSAKLVVNFSASNVDAEVKLAFSPDILEDYTEDVLEEFTVRGYFGKLKLEAGKMKVVWGKGDKLHVIDNFNSDDYTDFIIPDYIDRRLATPMFRALLSFQTCDIRLEGVFTPGMRADRYASEGIWLPQASYDLEQQVAAIVAGWAYDTDGSASAAGLVSAASFDAASLYPDTQKLKYSQAGLRLTGTFGSVDWGVSYYWGHYKSPSANLSATIAAGDLPTLDYDVKQTFGLEAATVVGRFNLRAEAAYNLTEDTAGDDPWVHNNSVGWLFGFDFDIPVSNININIQETGTLILGGSKVDDAEGFAEWGAAASSLKGYDVDYDETGYTNNKLVFDVSDSLLNDKIVPEVKVLWGIERGDVVVMPSFEYKPGGNLSLKLSGMYIWCANSDSEFYEWHDNSFVNAALKCMF